MKALITGITGFVGGHLAEHLLASGDEVIGVSASGRWPPRTPVALSKHVRLVAADLAASEATQALTGLGALDCIYHLAAISIPSECGGDSPTAKALAANVGGTKHILDWATANQVRRVVFVSTSHVYAQPLTGEERCRETDAPRPKNAYGKTKLLAEEAALDVASRGRTEVVIARAFQHTGPRQNPPMMLPEWAAQFAGSAHPIVVRNRDTWIDLSDVRDVVQAYRLLMERGENGAIYNVASGVPNRTGEILDTLARVTGESRSIEETRPGVRFDPIADIAKITARTGWTPRIALEQTIQDVWRWHRSA